MTYHFDSRYFISKYDHKRTKVSNYYRFCLDLDRRTDGRTDRISLMDDILLNLCIATIRHVYHKWCTNMVHKMLHVIISYNHFICTFGIRLYFEVRKLFFLRAALQIRCVCMLVFLSKFNDIASISVAYVLITTFNLRTSLYRACFCLAGCHHFLARRIDIQSTTRI